MKLRILAIIVLLLFAWVTFPSAEDLPPAVPLPPGLAGDGNGGIIVPGVGTFGAPITLVDTEYSVWQAKDINGDVVAKMTVTCSVLEDGAQLCNVLLHAMIVPGTLIPIPLIPAGP